MKFAKTTLFALWTGVLALSGSTLTAATALYTTPSSAGEPLAVLDANPAALGVGHPVDDSGLAAEGWAWMDYPGSFESFAAPEDMNADGTLREGASLYLRPDKSSPVVTVFEAHDEAAFAPAGEWVQVSMAKQIPVFFISDKPLERTPPAAPVDVEPAAPEAPAEAAPVDVEPAVAVAEADARPATAPTAQPEAAAEGQPMTAPTYRPRQERPEERKNEQVQDYEGILKVAKRGLRNKTGFSFVLNDARGKRVAVIDMRNAPTHPVEMYIDKPVSVHGVMEPLPYARKLRVIRAQLIRLK